MLKESPKWNLKIRWSPEFSIYNRAQLFEDKVVGVWFCADRETGRKLWERLFFRPNQICGITEGIVFAYNIVDLRFPGTGCYGISVESGRLKWTAHGRWLWGWLLRALDFIPFFANEFRDSASFVKEGECYCESGRVLDSRTGRTLRKVPIEDMKKIRGPQYDLFPDLLFKDEDKIEYEFSKQSTGMKDSLFEPEVFIASQRNKDGNVNWAFDFSELGYNYIDRLRHPPFTYFLVSEEPEYKPGKSSRSYPVPNLSICHLLTLDENDGKIVQDFLVSPEKLADCRLESIDEQGLLVKASPKTYQYYERVV